MMRRLPIAIALGSVATGLLLFAALPLLLVLARALGLPAAPSLEILAGAFAEEASRTAFLNTALISTLVALFAIAVGVPVAFLLARFELPRARTMRTLLTLPAVVPPYLLGIAWIDLANPSTGLLNQLARALGASGPVLDCYTPLGIVWVLGLSFYPLLMLPVLNALERMDASLEESARISGASPARLLFEITLPLVAPAIASGAVLVFLATAATFGVPYLLGTAGQRRIELLTTAIANHITVGGEAELGKAMAISLALLALSAAVAVIGELASRGERKFAIVSGKGGRARPVRVSRATQRGMTAGLALVIAVAVVLPMVTLLWVSLLKTWGGGFGPSNWSLDSYRRVLLENHDTAPAVIRSLVLATTAASIAVAAGALVAYARNRRPSAATRALESLSTLPYAVPGTVLALGLLLAWSREVRVIVLEHATFALDLFAGPFALLIAYAVKYLAFGVRLSGTALVQIDPALEEAARTAGATRARAAIDVIVPLLLPALGAAWLLVFLPVLSEITMSILLVGPGTTVVGTVLFELQSYADPPSAAVLACLLLFLTLSGNEILRRSTGGRGGF
ncbi:MAG: iron ABC transporter permease [Deltaproteobacteria bacterium]|nr:iron ABC transporter permease [Deltaproteobacteria bacterium]